MGESIRGGERMTGKILRFVAYHTPGPVIRWLGRLQFTHPALGRIIRALGGKATSGVGKIRDGRAAGLLIDASGGNPGYLLGTSDMPEQKIAEELISLGDVVYDIGANLGFYSLLFSNLAGAEGKVYAFEPFPSSAARVRRNVDLNSLQKPIQILEIAVSDSDGTCRLDTSADGDVQHSITRESDQGITVQQATIDSCVNCGKIQPPNFIKMDIEGAELLAFDGAKETLAKHKPAILCEVHWLGPKFLQYFEQELKPLGYSLSNLDGGDVPWDHVRWHAVLTPASHKQ